MASRLQLIGLGLLMALAPQVAGAEDLPLQPARELDFETDSGTWMSLDVSPDGRSIYTDMPTVITATNNGVSQFFAGCFVGRKSNVPVGDATDPDPNWRFFDAELVVVDDLQAGLDTTIQGCTI